MHCDRYRSIRNEIYNECALCWKDVVLSFVDYNQSKKRIIYVKRKMGPVDQFQYLDL